MDYKKGVIGHAIAIGICAFLWSVPLSLAQSDEQTYDVDVCVSSDLSALIQSQEIGIFNFDAKGIMRSNTEDKVFDNSTVHVIGTMLFEGKELTAFSFMKYLDRDGDYVIFRYTQNPGEKAATTTILAGTGKYKGITGGGKAVPIARGNPVVPDTIQFCNNHKGTFTLPK